MTVHLVSGANTALTAERSGLRRVRVGLGWNFPAETEPFDLDASALLVQTNGRVRGDLDLVFYNNPTDATGCVRYHGDNVDGSGEGDDETLTIDLSLVPADINKIVICATIHKAAGRTFGDVDGGSIRLTDLDSQEELVRFDLQEKFVNVTSMLFGEVYKHNDVWKFRALGMGFEGGFQALISSFGVEVQE